MMVFEKAESFETCKPGQWILHEGDKVFILCPHEHAYPAMLTGHKLPAKDWAIDASGAVTPSVWIKNEDCNFHEFIKLAGWDARAVGPEGSRTPA